MVDAFYSEPLDSPSSIILNEAANKLNSIGKKKVINRMCK